jgi:hypothetical protein
VPPLDMDFNLIFWWYFKVPHANYFLTNFGSFGQIWKDFAA